MQHDDEQQGQRSMPVPDCGDPSRVPDSRVAITWARPSLDVAFCAVAHESITGSVVTYCNGRWSKTDTLEQTTEMPARRCGGCRVALGLDELRDAPAIDRRPAIDLAFDITDELGGEGG